MAFRYLLIGGLHCVIDESDKRVVDMFTEEAAAYKQLRMLNGEEEPDAALAKGEMPSGTTILTSDDLAAAAQRARESGSGVMTSSKKK